jgi:hypothetical protein
MGRLVCVTSVQVAFEVHGSMKRHEDGHTLSVSPRRFDAEISADLPSEDVVDLSMPRDGRVAILGGSCHQEWRPPSRSSSHPCDSR